MLYIAIAAALSFLIKAVPVFLASNTGIDKNSFAIRISTKSNFMILGALIANGLFSTSIGSELDISAANVYLQGVSLLVITVAVALISRNIYISILVSTSLAALLYIALNGV